MENKKVRNAQPLEYNNIQFKSKLEVASYKLLQAAGFNPEYEQHTFHLWEGKKFSVPCYDLHKDRKLHKEVWGLNTYKPVKVRYTPDFVCYVPDATGIQRMIVVEAKGKQNDVYPYKKKLFREWLEENAPHSMFFEIHNQKQLKEAIEIIKKFSE